MSRICIFGGSFNPIHNGHIALARQVINHNLADEVWFLVTPQNPLKESHDLLPEHLRLQMTQEALRNETHMTASDYEFHLTRPSYTWHTLCQLKADFPEHDFSLLIGGDNWACFDRWYHHDDILHTFPVIIYPRSGYTTEAESLPEGVTLLPPLLYNVSSTEVRDLMAQGKDVSHLVPAAVVRMLTVQAQEE